jgi:DNA-binding NarL/FixJ family response regulator
MIADDHTLVAQACQKLLAPEFHVVAIVGDGHALIRSAMALKPDAILIDIHMPRLNGLDAGQQIIRILPRVKLVYAADSPDLELAAEAFRRGASGYLLKTSAATDIITAIRHALKNEIFLSAGIAREPIETRIAAGVGSDANALTIRQREVLQLLAEGHAMKQVADVLNLTTRTVAFHKYRIREALHLSNDAEMVRYAVEHHLLSASSSPGFTLTRPFLSA